METKKSGYSSRFALICVLIGGSVGTGNLWRFPRLVANTGGAAFIIVMTVCVFLTALPLLYVENFMGRATRHSAPGAFHDICGKKYTCLGMFATLAYLLMLAYYLVVLAWCLRYAGMSLTGGYFGVDKEALFTSVTTADPATIGVWVVALVLVYFGIAKQEALEKVSSILMPCLFGLLMAMCGVNILIDCGVSRKKGSLIVVLFLAIVGLPSAINPDILNNQDNVWGFGLMWGSLFLGIAAMKFGAKKMRTKFLNPVSDIKINKTFDILAPYVAPLLVLAVLVVWMVSSIGWSDTPWAMTFTGVTTGTILYQWIVVFIASIFLSRWYNKKIVANYYDGEEFPEMPEGLL